MIKHETDFLQCAVNSSCCWGSVDWRDSVDLSALAILPEIFIFSHQLDGKQTCMNKIKHSPLLMEDWLDQIYLCDSGSKEDFVGVESARCSHVFHCHQKHRKLEISKQTSWSRKIRWKRCEEREQSRGLNRLNTEVRLSELRDVCTQTDLWSKFIQTTWKHFKQTKKIAFNKKVKLKK